jgi:hypothetical protein
MTNHKNITEQESIHCLNALLVGCEFLELLDKVKEFTIFRHGLKQKVNNLLPELEKHCDQLELITGTDDTIMFTLMDRKNLMKEISCIRPEYKLGLAELLNQFNNAPELVLHRNGVKIA